jgi:hypothetical protein
MAVKVQFRRGTASQWTSANPTLSQGEAGYEYDTGKFKIGTGTETWNALAYSSGPTGATGATGATGTTGDAGATGAGVPVGGTTGQVLSKIDGTNYNTEWTTPYPEEPTGTTTGTVTQSAQLAGYLGMPQNPEVATETFSYTLAASDAGKHIYYTGTPTSAALVIPANTAVAFEIGTTFVVMNDLGAATDVSISITTDTLQLAGTGTTGTRTLARYGVATCTKVTATKWIISGNGLT